VLVVARFHVYEDDAERFAELVATAVEALASRPGHQSSRLARALDDVTVWTLVSEWESVGAYRRALSNPDVRMASAPLMGTVADEPTAYEVLWDSEEGRSESDHGEAPLGSG